MNIEGRAEHPLTPEAEAQQNFEALRNNYYPGRGIVMGFSSEGIPLQVYWVEGRSENSRNRLLVQERDMSGIDKVSTVAFDESKVQDPSLIIYPAMMEVRQRHHIVSNGSQTLDVRERVVTSDILRGDTQRAFRKAIHCNTYEPDAPNFTNRITGLFSVSQKFPFTFAQISRGSDNQPRYSFYTSGDEPKGIGRGFHTYKHNGEPLPAYEGDPKRLPLIGSIDDVADMYWNALHPDTRVALVVKGIYLDRDRSAFTIRNHHQK